VHPHAIVGKKTVSPCKKMQLHDPNTLLGAIPILPGAIPMLIGANPMRLAAIPMLISGSPMQFSAIPTLFNASPKKRAQKLSKS